MPGTSDHSPQVRKPMDPRAVKLERLRQDAALYSSLAGNLADYLDRGRPSADQARKAEADMTSYEQSEARARRALSDYLTELRAAAPRVVREWTDYHIAICKRILKEPDPGPQPDGLVSDQSVRLYVARETLAAWRKVRRGEEDMVSINPVFLSDYDEEVSALVDVGNA
jgi:hypothetical protein